MIICHLVFSHDAIYGMRCSPLRSCLKTLLCYFTSCWDNSRLEPNFCMNCGSHPYRNCFFTTDFSLNYQNFEKYPLKVTPDTQRIDNSVILAVSVHKKAGFRKTARARWIIVYCALNRYRPWAMFGSKEEIHLQCGLSGRDRECKHSRGFHAHCDILIDVKYRGNGRSLQAVDTDTKYRGRRKIFNWPRPYEPNIYEWR